MSTFSARMVKLPVWLIVPAMVDEDRHCIDVLTQIHAVRVALTCVETELLQSHLSYCIESAIVSGDAEEQHKNANELIELLDRASR